VDPPIMQKLARPSLKLLAFLFGLVVIASAAAAQPAPPTLDITKAPAVLVMISDPGCPYCARWEREVAPGYLASEDSKIAPLVRRDRRAADIAFIERVVYSPTFVMLVRGREVGRIVGYGGADLFWMQLAAIMDDVRVALQRSGSAAPNFAALQVERR